MEERIGETRKGRRERMRKGAIVSSREYGSTLFVELARAVSPTNTDFLLTFFTNPTSGGSL